MSPYRRMRKPYESPALSQVRFDQTLHWEACGVDIERGLARIGAADFVVLSWVALAIAIFGDIR